MNPPQAMRVQSKGIDFSSPMLARRGSFITLALTRSRWARDLNTIQESITISPGLAWAKTRERHAELHVKIIAHTFTIFQRAMLSPDDSRFLSHAAVSGQVLLLDRQDKAIDVSQVNSLLWFRLQSTI